MLPSLLIKTTPLLDKLPLNGSISWVKNHVCSTFLVRLMLLSRLLSWRVNLLTKKGRLLPRKESRSNMSTLERLRSKNLCFQSFIKTLAI
jgi:hypothetical protein